MESTDDIPRPPEVRSVKAQLPRVIELSELVIREACNPYVEEDLGWSHMRSAPVRENDIIKAKEDGEIQSLENLEISRHSKTAD